MLPFIGYYFHNAGIGTVIIHTSPPAFGQIKTQVDFLENFFNLHSYDMHEGCVLDFLDRVIGVFERRQQVFYKNLLNPIEWLKYFIRLPFEIITFAGFNGEQVESSLVGRIWKLLASILTAMSGLWALIQMFEYYFDIGGPG